MAKKKPAKRKVVKPVKVMAWVPKRWFSLWDEHKDDPWCYTAGVRNKWQHMDDLLVRVTLVPIKPIRITPLSPQAARRKEKKG